MGSALSKAVRAQGGAVVKPHQVQAMVLAARRAYVVQSRVGLVDDGVDFDTWRKAAIHDVVGAAAPSSFRAVTQRDYAAVVAYFEELAGREAERSSAIKSGDERRRALWALNLVEGESAEVFGGRGEARKYADALFWKIHKTDRQTATARQVWAVIFTLRNRARARGTEARHPKSAETRTRKAVGARGAAGVPSAPPEGSERFPAFSRPV